MLIYELGEHLGGDPEPEEREEPVEEEEVQA